MNIFISHNKADKKIARSLAIALIELGENVWFDEWQIRPGDSITGGIESGLTDAEIFVLVWSENAKSSNWVGTEMNAYIRRRVDDQSLRIVPIMIDDTPLPILVADYKGFSIRNDTKIEDIAAEITGNPSQMEIAARIQSKLIELTNGNPHGELFQYTLCPRCGSTNLTRRQETDYQFDRRYYIIRCESCGWEEGTEL